jgi:hypothetical protein
MTTDVTQTLIDERDRARTLAQLLEEELAQALELIDTLNSKLAGLEGGTNAQ